MAVVFSISCLASATAYASENYEYASTDIGATFLVDGVSNMQSTLFPRLSYTSGHADNNDAPDDRRSAVIYNITSPGDQCISYSYALGGGTPPQVPILFTLGPYDTLSQDNFNRSPPSSGGFHFSSIYAEDNVHGTAATPFVYRVRCPLYSPLVSKPKYFSYVHSGLHMSTGSVLIGSSTTFCQDYTFASSSSQQLLSTYSPYNSTNPWPYMHVRASLSTDPDTYLYDGSYNPNSPLAISGEIPSTPDTFLYVDYYFVSEEDASVPFNPSNGFSFGFDFPSYPLTNFSSLTVGVGLVPYIYNSSYPLSSWVPFIPSSLSYRGSAAVSCFLSDDPALLNNSTIPEPTDPTDPPEEPGGDSSSILEALKSFFYLMPLSWRQRLLLSLEQSV